MELFCYNKIIAVNKSVVSFADIMPDKEGKNVDNLTIHINIEFKNAKKADLYEVGFKYKIEFNGQ